jgi:hypothetical protein
MRKVACAASFILLALVACDKDEQKNRLVDSVVGDASTPLASPSNRPGAREAGAAPQASGPVAERPIPKGQTMVTQGAPQEVQMKAIACMASMKAPHIDDPPADEAYATDLVTKLKPVVLAMDKGGGGEKSRFNRVEMQASGRQIDMLMAEGCDAKAPFNAVVQRLNIPLSTLLSHGVLVLRCNDLKIQCLQSVRDQEDVLCATAPRHK